MVLAGLRLNFLYRSKGLSGIILLSPPAVTTFFLIYIDYIVCGLISFVNVSRAKSLSICKCTSHGTAQLKSVPKNWCYSGIIEEGRVHPDQRQSPFEDNFSWKLLLNE